MSSRKQDQLDGHDPWEWEIAYWIYKGVDPEKARAFTMIRWMYHGDLRPLAAAIWEGQPLNQDVLDWLAAMIVEGRLTVKRRWHGRPRPPDKFARDIAAAILYEHRATDKSEEAFREIAASLAMSHQSVRQAVTRWRKSSAK